MKRYPIKGDRRYTISREFCGYAEARFVVRFCGDWIGQSRFYSSAVVMAVGEKARRSGALIITAIEK
jgi:hypothetical protein